MARLTKRHCVKHLEVVGVARAVVFAHHEHFEQAGGPHVGGQGRVEMHIALEAVYQPGIVQAQQTNGRGNFHDGKPAQLPVPGRVVPARKCASRRNLRQFISFLLLTLLSLVSLTSTPPDSSAPSPATPVPYFEPLDIVRFGVATLILITHSYEHWLAVPAVAAATLDSGGQPLWWATKLAGFVGSFNVGVDIFFLMSGFLITYLLLLEKQRYGRIDIKSFYVRRVLRIWPLYYFCVAMAPLLSHYGHEPVANMPMHLAFLGNFDLMRHGWGSTAVNHLWSICIEEHFYLLWPLLVAFVPRQRLTTVFGAVIVVSFLTRLYYFYFVPDSYLYLYLNTLCRWDALAVGALLAYGYFEGYRLPLLPAALRWMIYGMALLVFVNDSYGNWDNIFLLSFKKYVFLGVIAFALSNILFNPDSLIKWRGRTIFHYFGKISYGIYMYHGFVIYGLLHLGDTFKTPLLLLWVFVVTLVVSAISYELVEKPILRLKKYADAFGSRRTVAAGPTAAAVPELVQ